VGGAQGLQLSQHQQAIGIGQLVVEQHAIGKARREQG
jgi:hypothetical protein